MRLLYCGHEDAVSGRRPGRAENAELPRHRSKIGLHGLDHNLGFNGLQVHAEKKDPRRRIQHDPMIQNTIKHFGHVNGIQVLHSLLCGAKRSSGSLPEVHGAEILRFFI